MMSLVYVVMLWREVLQRDQKLQRCFGANRRFLCVAETVVGAMKLDPQERTNERIVEVPVPLCREETVEVMNRDHSHNVPVPQRQEQLVEPVSGSRQVGVLQANRAAQYRRGRVPASKARPDLGG